MPSARIKPRCLVVGAGSAGLAAVREALAAGLDPIAYEASAGCGGAWRYDPDPQQCIVRFDNEGWATFLGPDETDADADPARPTRSALSPMYPSLRTNVPTSLMQYRGCPFPPEVGLFPSHAQVQAYLEAYAEDLLPNIKYNHRVTCIRHTTPADSDPALGHPRRRWFAEISPIDGTAGPFTEQFDCVMVANGHYSKPYVPWTEGLASWSRELLHARWYRTAEAFRNKTVLVVGNSASGYDITRELAGLVHSQRTEHEPRDDRPLKKVYQSARSPSKLGIPFDAPDAPEWAREITVVPAIRRISNHLVTFEDGTSRDDIDTIIFATGYYFTFPFLRASDAPWDDHPVTRPPPTPTSTSTSTSQLSTAPVDGGLRLHHLDDRHLFYLPDPTIAFLCLPYLVIPFPLAQLQARLASLHFVNHPQLPKPLDFVPGISEDEPETRESVVVGHPGQYDLMDRMMRESGDIPTTSTVKQADKPGMARNDREGNDVYGETTQAERDLRTGAKALRRAVLGY
ncbi:uncharacterized protein JCM15063_001464 [Sporobolomyces koalae]|uniref:uncharacterized protein n=1 Tax=Sporobolomyces koalae TaxID=500713 RepID=UPI00317ACFAF